MTNNDNLRVKARAPAMEERLNTPLVNLAVTHLREVLAQQSFAGGGRLPAEAELASQLGVSRPVLRQALSVLRDEGLVESRRGSGTFARPLSKPTAAIFGKPESIGDLEDCLRFRAVIESRSAAEAARRKTSDSISKIEAAVRAMETCPPRDSAVAENDMNFHIAVARATGNRYYGMTLEFLQPHILFGLQLGRQLRNVPPDITSRRVAQEHRAILEAIKHGDAHKAAERMEAHLSAGIERIFGNRSW